MKKLIYLFTAIVFIASACKKENDSITTLTFEKSITIKGIIGSNTRIECDNAGNFYLWDWLYMNQAPPMRIIRTNDQSKADTFKTNDQEILHPNFLSIDNNDVLHIVQSEIFEPSQYLKYNTNGTQISSSILTFGFFNMGMALDESQQNAFITNMFTAEVSVVKYSLPGFDTLQHIDKNAITAMIPGFNAAEKHEIMLTGIAYHNNNIFIPVEKTTGDEPHDGILVLDNSLNFVKYITGEWLFNGPRDIGF
jgi:hypothetical protein